MHKIIIIKGGGEKGRTFVKLNLTLIFEKLNLTLISS